MLRAATAVVLLLATQPALATSRDEVTNSCGGIWQGPGASCMIRLDGMPEIWADAFGDSTGVAGRPAWLHISLEMPGDDPMECSVREGGAGGCSLRQYAGEQPWLGALVECRVEGQMLGRYGCTAYPD